MPTANAPNVRGDTAKFLEFLDAQPEVRRGSVGTVGFCMGGTLSLLAAGASLIDSGVGASAVGHLYVRQLPTRR